MPSGPLHTPAVQSPSIVGYNSHGPALHIDIQIHISADASGEQIDQIFASMSKHLYGSKKPE
jgi:hypothetical protein